MFSLPDNVIICNIWLFSVTGKFPDLLNVGDDLIWFFDPKTNGEIEEDVFQDYIKERDEILIKLTSEINAERLDILLLTSPQKSIYESIYVSMIS